LISTRWHRGGVQVFGSVLATTSKLVVGKEGTLTNVGACIAHMLSTVAAKLMGSGGKRRGADKASARQGFSEADMRDLVTVGAAAGVSACFRAPVRAQLGMQHMQGEPAQ
jgi:chloride channel 7